MHIHILGVAGTFMGGIALIAKSLGHQVSGMDASIYPPMSTQLSQQNIDFIEGYDANNLPDADLYIIGNAMSRGNACVEKILNQKLAYISGAQWLSENVLRQKWVIAIAGTHGKTTTAAMTTWILEQANLNPSYLVGGVMKDFATSARLTDSLFFVIEADEYDTAFFDKRSKFVHYHPNTLVINNLEFDHADIFDSLADIQKQFNHLLRLVPDNGLILYPDNTQSIGDVIKKGVWSPTQIMPKPQVEQTQTGTRFEIENGKWVDWKLLGQHNASNGLSALMASHHAGVPLETAIVALNKFSGVQRRLEVVFEYKNQTIYDDFAHHPTAIKTTLEALRNKVGDELIVAIVELRSNTMKQGFHQQTLLDALKSADLSLLVCGEKSTREKLIKLIYNDKIRIFSKSSEIIKPYTTLKPKHTVIMSNGGFDGIQQQIIKKLQ